MNCPYCQKRVNGMTGFKEAEAFLKHLNNSFRKVPGNIKIHDGEKTVIGRRKFDLVDAIRILSESGQ